jgi:hypothetical protein
MTGSDPPPRRRRIRVIECVVLVAFALTLGAFTIPISHTFSDEFTASRAHLGSWMLDAPLGAVVSGTWSTSGGSNVDFDVVDSNDYPIYQTNGTSGSFSFPSTYPPYAFAGLPRSNATIEMSVIGSYSSPIL